VKGKIYHSSERSDWVTPPEPIARIEKVGPIAVDPCAGDFADHAAINIRHGRHSHGWHGDGLLLDWSKLVAEVGGGLVYSNSPYGTGVINRWVEKYIREAARAVEIVALVPGSTGSRWFRRIVATASAACAWGGRLHFIDPLTGEPAMTKSKKTGKWIPTVAPFWSWFVLWSPYVSTALRFLYAFEGAGDLYLLQQPPTPHAVSKMAASGVQPRSLEALAPPLRVADSARNPEFRTHGNGSPLGSSGSLLALLVYAYQAGVASNPLQRQEMLGAIQRLCARHGVDIGDLGGEDVRAGLKLAGNILEASEEDTGRA
jgi:hypothetical protein